MNNVQFEIDGKNRELEQTLKKIDRSAQSQEAVNLAIQELERDLNIKSTTAH
jgi:hypothetical protein